MKLVSVETLAGVAESQPPSDSACTLYPQNLLARFVVQEVLTMNPQQIEVEPRKFEHWAKTAECQCLDNTDATPILLCKTISDVIARITIMYKNVSLVNVHI